MTHFAPVSPLQGLHELVKADQLGTYQLLIAPIVLKHDWGYGKFFYEHSDQTIILDNGVIELGYPLAVDDLYKAAKTVSASVIVLPDTIDDARYTMKQVKQAVQQYRKFDRATDTMGVVQGTTLEECMECARSHVEAGVDWLAIPRGLTPHLGSRVELVQHLASEYGLPMHVLGFSDNLQDDFAAAAAHRLVRGIDAATPMWTTELLPATPPSERQYSLGLGKRPKAYWDQPVAEHAAINVRTARRWLKDAVAARTSREGLAAATGQETRG